MKFDRSEFAPLAVLCFGFYTAISLGSVYRVCKSNRARRFQFSLSLCCNWLVFALLISLCIYSVKKFQLLDCACGVASFSLIVNEFKGGSGSLLSSVFLAITASHQFAVIKSFTSIECILRLCAVAICVLSLAVMLIQSAIFKTFYRGLTFSWLNPLIIRGFEENFISLKDVDNLNVTMDTPQMFTRLRAQWALTNNLLKSLIRTFGWKIAAIMLIQFLENLVCFAQPQLLKYLIQFFTQYDSTANTPPLTKGLAICVGMFTVSFTATNLNNQFFIRMYKIGLQIKGSLMSLVYSKVLRLSSHAHQDHSTGDIVNLVSIDVNRVQNLSQQVPLFFSIPTKIILAIISLYSLLGNAIFAALLVVVIMIPMNTILLRILKRLKKIQMKHKDSRIKLISETLTAIKCVKLYNWEFSMLESINKVRNELELKNLRAIGALISVNRLFWCLIPLLISSSTFYFYDKPLTSDIVFPALSLFGLLTAPIINIPSLFSCIIEASIAFERLSKFLHAEETQQTDLQYSDDLKDPEIQIKNVTFSRGGLEQLENFDEKVFLDEEASIENSKNGNVALKDISLSILDKEFVCVVGRVGSGKSTLLNAIIGELAILPDFNSFFSVKGSIAYCSQIPWILNTSIKENIIFGKDFDEDFYNKVVEACDLNVDFQALCSGDDTIVGEKGISLSGGQKARVSLARAIYSDKKIYVLDDILSAVDCHVSQKIIESVLSSDTGLLKNKIRVLVTNNHNAISYADRCIYMNNCEIAVCDESSDLTLTPVSTTTSKRSSSSSSTTTCTKSPKLPKKKAVTTPKLINEHSKNGSVKWSTYFEYAKSCSTLGIFLFFMMILTGSILSFLSKYWLKNISEKNDGMKSSERDNNMKKFIIVYAILGFTSGLFVFLKTLILYQMCSINASKKLHASMIRSVLESPMAFFDTTPLGRILNRFSGDINKIDENLPKTFIKFFTSMITTFFTFGVIVFHLPLCIIPMSILMAIYHYYQSYYIATSRDLKRIGSSTKSPVFNHLQESLTGTETIRSFGKLTSFEEINMKHVDFNLKSLFVLRSINKWLTFRLQFIGAIVILLTSGLALFSLTTTNPLTNGIVGLVMGYALEITESLSSIVKSSVDIETNVVCVERILEYSSLKSEASFVCADDKAISKTQWPNQGAIEFNKFSTRYRKNLGLVLKNLSLNINSNEKIGIVGRTGAGKSSFAMAFFRLLEADSGSISIDGVETDKVGLNLLRGNLSIIPQDCLAIQGTIRENLDPLKKHSDNELLAALKASHFEDYLVVQDNGRYYDNQSLRLLDMPIYESGRNLSVGQRQLLCLARALLNKSKILILDEATAAVDSDTDKIVQDTIRQEFSEKTVLTIAHRLDTVMHCDRILGLDQGQVVEFDTPANLLKNEASLFFKLCDEGGFL